MENNNIEEKVKYLFCLENSAKFIGLSKGHCENIFKIHLVWIVFWQRFVMPLVRTLVESGQVTKHQKTCFRFFFYFI